jgi:heme O synthase-like polyprenyltransferase
MAIAWNFRDDYEKGGFQLHNSGDSSGIRLARKSFLYTIVLHLFVFAPYFLDLNQKSPGKLYLFFAIGLSSYIMLKAYGFLFSGNRDKSAKQLFVATIIYLPLLFAALVIDRYL